MQIVIGNKTKVTSQEEVQTLLKDFKNVEIDLGTGDGRYIYKEGLKNSETLYVGIDPVEKQLQIYSRKAVRKKLKNTLFVIGTAENIPEELISKASIINVFLPWGSLLDYIANSNPVILTNIKKLLKPNGILKIIFGYTSRSEPNETDRLNLEMLDKKYLQEVLIPKYEGQGLLLKDLRNLSREELRKMETSWSKKLSFGKDRPIFFLSFQLKDE